jgi:2-polyprenyl-3-methyl-5-hydroxy-6-metoxy-1,4-benzoquinol methylase
MSDQSHWDERYKTGDTPWETGHPSSELVRVVAEAAIQPGRALEVGCGTGTNAVWLSQQGFNVTALDLSALAIDRARQRADAAGVRVSFLVADVLEPSTNLAGPFDFFFDRGCYHVVRRVDVTPYLATLDRLTHPGTIGLVLTGNAHEPRVPGPPVVTKQQIREELGKTLEIVHLREFRFDQSKHDDHRFLGWSILLRRTAQ